MPRPPFKSSVALAGAAFALIVPSVKGNEVRAVVEVEEVFGTVVSGKNGAGPLWAYGAPLLVRQGHDVYLSMIEAGKDIPPLCNMEWQIWRRREDGWKLVQRENNYRQREPCPIAGFHDNSILLSVNPSLTPPGTWYEPCRPLVLRLDPRNPVAPPSPEQPAWAEGTHFTDHSYRGFAADGERGELLLLNINARTEAQFASYRDAKGMWHERGQIRFPIRACYPQVSLRNRAGHVLAIGDILEPVEAWRRFKEEHRKGAGYAFRRLFYAVAPDLDSGGFAAPIEVASVEDSAGNIINLDLYVGPSGAAHLLYLRRPYSDELIREHFFPGKPASTHLDYAVVKAGAIVSRRTLAEYTGQPGGFIPQYARFHVRPDGSLYVVMSARLSEDNASALRDYVAELGSDGERPAFTLVGLDHPFGKFFTNTLRGGSRPSDVIDLLGDAGGGQLRYARVRLAGDRGNK